MDTDLPPETQKLIFQIHGAIGDCLDKSIPITTSGVVAGPTELTKAKSEFIGNFITFLSIYFTNEDLRTTQGDVIDNINKLFPTADKIGIIPDFTGIVDFVIERANLLFISIMAVPDKEDADEIARVKQLSVNALNNLYAMLSLVAQQYHLLLILDQDAQGFCSGLSIDNLYDFFIAKALHIPRRFFSQQPIPQGTFVDLFEEMAKNQSYDIKATYESLQLKFSKSQGYRNKFFKGRIKENEMGAPDLLLSECVMYTTQLCILNNDNDKWGLKASFLFLYFISKFARLHCTIEQFKKIIRDRVFQLQKLTDKITNLRTNLVAKEQARQALEDENKKLEQSERRQQELQKEVGALEQQFKLAAQLLPGLGEKYKNFEDLKRLEKQREFLNDLEGLEHDGLNDATKAQLNAIKSMVNIMIKASEAAEESQRAIAQQAAEQKQLIDQLEEQKKQREREIEQIAKQQAQNEKKIAEQQAKIKELESRPKPENNPPKPDDKPPKPDDKPPEPDPLVPNYLKVISSINLKNFAQIDNRLRRIIEKYDEPDGLPSIVRDRLDGGKIGTLDVAVLNPDGSNNPMSQIQFYKMYYTPGQKRMYTDYIGNILASWIAKAKQANAPQALITNVYLAINTVQAINTNFEDVTGIGRVLVRVRPALGKDSPQDPLFEVDPVGNIVYYKGRVVIVTESDKEQLSYRSKCAVYGSMGELNTAKTFGQNTAEAPYGIEKGGYVHAELIKKLGSGQDLFYTGKVGSDSPRNRLFPDGLPFGPFTQVFGADVGTSAIFTTTDEQTGGLSIEQTVKNMLNGTNRSQYYNLCVLSFGISGSGKTYTLLGDADARPIEDRENAAEGIAHQAIKALFDEHGSKIWSADLIAVQAYQGLCYDALWPHKEGEFYKIQYVRSDGTTADNKARVNIPDGEIYHYDKARRTLYVRQINAVDFWTTLGIQNANDFTKVIQKSDAANKIANAVLESYGYTNSPVQEWERYKQQCSQDLFRGLKRKLATDVLKDITAYQTLADRMENLFVYSTSFEPETKAAYEKKAKEFAAMEAQLSNASKPLAGFSIENYFSQKDRNNYDNGFLSRAALVDPELVYQENLDPIRVKEIINSKIKNSHPIKMERTNVSGNEAVKNFKDAYNIIFQNRPTRSTAMNPTSSRSHLFIILRIKVINPTTNLPEDDPVLLTICDMAGNEDPKRYAYNARREGFFIQETLKRGKNFAYYLRKYADADQLVFLQNDVIKKADDEGDNVAGAQPKGPKAMYAPAKLGDKPDQLPVLDTYFPEDIALTSSYLPAQKNLNHTRVIFNLLKYVIGYSNKAQLKGPQKGLTKILTFANMPGFLVQDDLAPTQAAVENQRRCIDSLASIDYTYSLTGLHQREKGKIFPWSRFGSSFGRRRRSRLRRKSKVSPKRTTKQRRKSSGRRRRKSISTTRKTYRRKGSRKPRAVTTRRRKRSYSY